MSSPHNDGSDSHDFIERVSSQNSWQEWSRYVLKELRRINEALESFKREQERAAKELHESLMTEIKENRATINTMKIDIALLQLKAGMAGIIAGIIVTLIGRFLSR
jgi:hypothetical protein